MKDLYVKANDLSEDILKQLPKQDIFSLDEIIGAFEELLYEYKSLEEEYDDYKEYVEDNMTERTHGSNYYIRHSADEI